MESPSPLYNKVFNDKRRRWLVLVAVVAATHILCQSLFLPYGNALRSFLADNRIPVSDQNNDPTLRSLTMFVVAPNHLTVNASALGDELALDELVKDSQNFTGGNTDHDSEQKEKLQDNSTELVTSHEVYNGSTSEKFEDLDDGITSDFVEKQKGSVLELAMEGKHGLQLEQIVKPNQTASMDNTTKNYVNQKPSSIITPSTNIIFLKPKESNPSSHISSIVLQNDLATTINISAMVDASGEKKMKCELPPKYVRTIQEMDSILLRHRRSSRAMRPRWSSPRDKEVFGARIEIEKAPNAVNDKELYAPLFRNVSMFKRSYELMEGILKIYVYGEGSKPIFHQPILNGLYASEGWFMKLMEGNKRFVVKDPQKAHLFYMPFSSRQLEFAHYVPNSHNRTSLRQYLKDYTEDIAAKYPYFNRTGGADHFLVGCHDWAPYETRHHMEHCIRALCNSDVTFGFKIGKDISLPVTNIRAARNPCRDLGGKPPSQRQILAFYAGSMHGYLRPILLQFWKDKDPSMKIFGPMPPAIARKMSYIQHMKSSKYCICPKGYEVHSPRVVESIYYGCVPVIISDNYVPPFFEVLDWAAFSLIIAEKDIPKLKDILLSIPEEKYIRMQLAVRKVQKHFLWHAKPEKYDLFHMILHSIWYNRVYQIKLR